MILTLCLLLTPQGLQEREWFRLHPVAGTHEIVVSVDRRDAPAETAIRELVRAMKWRVRASDAVIENLAPISLDLAIRHRDPRTVVQWIAATAGLEVEFREEAGQVVLSLTDSRNESPDTLGRRAIEWYEKMLDGRLGSMTGTAHFEALLGLGAALEDVGDLARAVQVYDRVYEEDDDRRFTARALLRSSAVHLALATRTGLPDLERRVHEQLAETAARRLLRLHAGRSNPAATLQLGRVLAQAERWQDCIQALQAEATTDPAIALLLARAFARSDQPERGVEVLDALYRSASASWSRTRFRDYHFLRGVCLEAVPPRAGDAEQARSRLRDAMRSLEIFVGSAGDVDPRRAAALTALARVYFATGRHVESRAAVSRVLAKKSQLTPRELQAARLVGTTEATVPSPEAGTDASIRTMFLAGRFADVVHRSPAIEENEGAPLIDVFHVARCHEELKHFARADEIYASIERRDLHRDREGRAIPGPWATAATRAREMMRWVAKSEGWTAPAIRWTIE